MDIRPFEDVSKSGGKVVRQAWLDDECRTAFAIGAFAQLRFSVAGKQDDRDGPSPRLALQVLDEQPSITARQGQVRDDDVGMRFRGLPTGLRTVSRRDRFEATSGETRDVQFTGVVVIVDDQYQRSSRSARVTAVHA